MAERSCTSVPSRRNILAAATLAPVAALLPKQANAAPSLAAAAPAPHSVAAIWAESQAFAKELDAANLDDSEASEALFRAQAEMEYRAARAPIVTRQDAVAKVRLALQSTENGWWANEADVDALKQVAAWLEAC